MKLVGFERHNFRLRETGVEVTGYNLYVSHSIPNERGKGIAAERMYLSDRRITDNGINLDAMIGKELVISYNRYGKVQNITLA